MSVDRWYTSYNHILEFAGVLVRADALDSTDDVLYFLEKPWKWDVDHQTWEGCGSPDLDDEGWGFFCRKLEQQDERASTIGCEDS